MARRTLGLLRLAAAHSIAAAERREAAHPATAAALARTLGSVVSPGSSVPSAWLWRRGLSAAASGGDGGGGTAAASAAALLQGLRGVAVQQRLEQLRRTEAVISAAQLREECRAALPGGGAGADAGADAEADRLADALHASGVVLRHGGLVYLRPGDVAAALSAALPGGRAALEARHAAAAAELAQLDAVQASVRRRAARRAAALSWGFFGALAAQWALLFRLTYWELSWDVMEPIGFFWGGATSLLSYMWFLRTRQDFTYSEATQRFMGRWERRALADAGFDAARWEAARDEAERCAEALAVLARRGAPPGGGGGAPA